jgi:hypothetical protein
MVDTPRHGSNFHNRHVCILSPYLPGGLIMRDGYSLLPPKYEDYVDMDGGDPSDAIQFVHERALWDFRASKLKRELLLCAEVIGGALLLSALLGAVIGLLMAL